MPKDDIHAGLQTGPMSTEPGPVIESRDVEIGLHLLTAPQDWVRRQANSMFLITEFALAKAEGDAEDGRLTVSSAMGSVADNIERWRGQFGGSRRRNSKRFWMSPAYKLPGWTFQAHSAISADRSRHTQAGLSYAGGGDSRGWQAVLREGLWSRENGGGPCRPNPRLRAVAQGEGGHGTAQC